LRPDRTLSETAIIATNTSSLSITAIAAELKNPQRVAGLHFFNPAPVMPLVEVITGLATAPDVAQTLMATAKAWGKHPVLARSTPGFIVNRVARPFYGEGLRLLQEGAADVATLDALIRDGFGFRMGPFELMDLIGHDVNFAVTSSIHAAYFGDPRFTPSVVQRELVEAGWLGRKTGRGFFDHSPGAAKPSISVVQDAPAPESVRFSGDLGPVEPLLERLRQANVPFERTQSQGGAAVISIDGATLALSDGRTATERARTDGIDNLVVFDLIDFSTGKRIALAKADNAPESARQRAAGLFQAAGVEASAIDDIPGMVCLRTVAMLVNEAADTVLHGVATAADVDSAMLKGVNYPRGPLALADELGAQRILEALNNIAQTYGEDRYRASALLRRVAASGRRFHTGDQARQ
jgi:3-hydroxybutyryl-CoA dehydrogenase